MGLESSVVSLKRFVGNGVGRAERTGMWLPFRRRLDGPSGKYAVGQGVSKAAPRASVCDRSSRDRHGGGSPGASRAIEHRPRPRCRACPDDLAGAPALGVCVSPQIRGVAESHRAVVEGAALRGPQRPPLRHLGGGLPDRRGGDPVRERPSSALRLGAAQTPSPRASHRHCLPSRRRLGLAGWTIQVASGHGNRRDSHALAVLAGLAELAGREAGPVVVVTVEAIARTTADFAGSGLGVAGLAAREVAWSWKTGLAADVSSGAAEVVNARAVRAARLVTDALIGAITDLAELAGREAGPVVVVTVEAVAWSTTDFAGPALRIAGLAAREVARRRQTESTADIGRRAALRAQTDLPAGTAGAASRSWSLGNIARRRRTPHLGSRGRCRRWRTGSIARLRRVPRLHSRFRRRPAEPGSIARRRRFAHQDSRRSSRCCRSSGIGADRRLRRTRCPCTARH